MHFELKEHKGFAALAGHGRLNIVGAPRLRAAVDDALHAGHTHLVVDLAETEFIDSTGLRMLIACLRTARDAGGDLRMANAGSQAQMTFKLTGVDRILILYPSVEAAYAGEG